MKATTKRRLKIYLPILLAIVLVGVIIAIILLNNKVTAKDYFNALRNSNYTKQVQHTTIIDNDLLIYEKVETIIFDSGKVYHKIEEKQLSEDVGTDYDLTITEFYYSQDKMYYFENNVWKEEDFKISNKLKTYYLQTDYFSALSFDKKIESEGRLQGKIKNDSVQKIVSGSDLTNMNLTIVVNKKFDIQKFDITAKTTTNRDVKIENIYSYSKELVNLPV